MKKCEQFAKAHENAQERAMMNKRAWQKRNERQHENNGDCKKGKKLETQRGMKFFFTSNTMCDLMIVKAMMGKQKQGTQLQV